MNPRHVKLIGDLAAKPEGTTMTEIHAALGRNWPSTDVKAMLGVLIEAGIVRREDRRVGPRGRRHGVYVAIADQGLSDAIAESAALTVPAPPRRRSDLGHQWVYFIQAVGGGPIKIGRALDPEMRMAMFQVGCPARLRIVGLIKGGLRLEKRLHLQFASGWVHGEWFEPTDELLDYIRLNATGEDENNENSGG